MSAPLAAAGLGSGATLRAQSGVTESTIVLGVSAAFSGPSRGLGIELYRGAVSYFEHVNQSGGVHGRKVVLKAYDDGYQPAPSVMNQDFSMFANKGWLTKEDGGGLDKPVLGVR